MITIGSLFTGYGGLDHAVQAALADTSRVAWTSDIEPGPARIIAHHHPGIPNLGDVTCIDWHDVEPVDVITGGSPCQDLSHAGRRAGMRAGTRSGLWAAMCDAIETIRPRLVVWENVLGALSAGADSDMGPCRLGLGCESDVPLRALGRVLGDLTEIGYDAGWTTLRASSIGAPHSRARIFVLAYPAHTESNAWRLIYGEPGDARDSDSQGRGSAGQSTPGQATRGRASAVTGGHHRAPVTLPSPRASDSVKGGPNQRGSKGDLALPSAVHHHLPTPKAGDADMGLPRTTGRPPERSTHLATRLRYTDYGIYGPTLARWEAVLGRPAPVHVEPNKNGTMQLAPRFVEWMMGLPAGHVTDVPGLSRAEQLRALGNGVVPQQAEAAIREITAMITEGLTA